MMHTDTPTDSTATGVAVPTISPFAPEPGPLVEFLPHEHGEHAALACARCGIRTEAPHARVIPATAAAPRRAPLPPNYDKTVTVLFGLCGTCTDREAEAAAIATLHPRLAAELGDPGEAPHRIGGVLDALAVVGVDPAVLGVDSASSRALGALITRLAPLGIGAQFARRYVGVWDRDAAEHEHARTPWSHVHDEHRADLRREVGALLAERVARARPPADLDPAADPAATPCLLCGIARPRTFGATVDGWRRIHTTRAALGALGRGGHDRVSGMICTRCDGYVTQYGVGPTSAERSIFAALGSSLAHTPNAPELGRVPCWGVLPAGTPPNATPWSHIDLDAIAEDLGIER